MGQQASFTLNTVVYNPDGSQNGVVRWMDRSGGVSSSFSALTQVYSSNSGARKWNRFTFRLDVPVVATASDACACAGALIRDSQFQIDLRLDPNSTVAERTDIGLRLKDLVSSTAFQDAIKNGDPFYG